MVAVHYNAGSRGVVPSAVCRCAEPLMMESSLDVLLALRRSRTFMFQRSRTIQHMDDTASTSRAIGAPSSIASRLTSSLSNSLADRKPLVKDDDPFAVVVKLNAAMAKLAFRPSQTE